MQHVDPKKTPLLYHYTSEKGLRGILNTKHFWLNHYKKVKDKREGTYFTESIFMLWFKDVFFNSSEQFERELHFSVVEQDSGLAFKKAVESQHYFLGCFCDHFIGLSNNEIKQQMALLELPEARGRYGSSNMWSNYAKNGYAIVFDTDILAQYSENLFGGNADLSFGLQKAIYLDSNNPKLALIDLKRNNKAYCNNIEQLIQKHFSCYARVCRYIKLTMEEKQKIYHRRFAESPGIKKKWEDFLCLVTHIKHNEFREEQEIRFSLYSADGLANNILPIERDQKQVPQRVKLPIVMDAVKYIIIAPGSSEQQLKQASYLRKEILCSNELLFLKDKIRFSSRFS